MNRKNLILCILIAVVILFSFNSKIAYSSPIADLRPISIANINSNSVNVNNNSTLLNVTYLQSPSDLAQQSFRAFLNQVAGIDTKNYNVTYFHIYSDTVLGSQKLQTSISAIISNNQENISIAMIFIEGKVRFYDLNLISGTLGGKSLDINGCLISSKSIIAKYQTNFNASYCDGFDQIVPSTIQTKNTTIDTEDALLTIQYSENLTNQVRYAKLYWYKKIGNITIPAQSIQAIVAKTGILTFFADNIGVYKVATTNVAVTKENALDISMPIINVYAGENRRTMESINSKLTYVTDMNGSRGDSFLVYPQWVISAKFEGSNVMGVNGYDVLIWADSGAVCSKGEQGNFNSGKSAPLNQGLLIVAITAFAAPIGILAYVKKQNNVIGRKVIFRLCGMTVLDALLLSLLMVQPSFAYPSTTFGSTYDVPGYEVTLDSSIADQIGDWSSDVGYTPYYWYGTNTTASNLYIGAYDHGESGSIVYYIGHGDDGTYCEDGYAIYDNSGNWVSAADIYDNSIGQSSGHHKVAIVWSCHQGEEIGEMPRAWLHTNSLSADGYNNPDYSGQAFIGWSGLAPFLSKDDWGTDAGYYFLYNFYYNALVLGYNLNFALDYSAQALWQENFDECVFSIGTGDGQMAVYGQGTMYLGEQQWCEDYVDYDYGYSIATVDNPIYLSGPQDNGQFVHLHAGEEDDFAWVTGYMNAEASGEIYLAGYSGTGYTSHLIVYVSEDYSNWDIICNGYITDTHPPYIHCGYSSGFRYIGIAVEDNIGLSACMYIDAVHVVE